MPRIGPTIPRAAAADKQKGGDCSKRGCCYDVGGPLDTRCQCSDCAWCAVYRFTGRDRFGRMDAVSRSSRVLGFECQRAGAWHRGKAIMLFPRYGALAVPADLLRRI